MVAPIILSSEYQKALFDVIKAANRASQQPSYGPDFNPGSTIIPLAPPYIFDRYGESDFLHI
jgi:hypothetical protein